MKPPACASERVIETYRNHTTTATRAHHFGPLQSADEPMPLREQLRWCALLAAIVGGGIGASLWWAL